MERYSDPFDDFDVYEDRPNVIARPPRIVLAFLAAGFVLDQFMLAPFLYEPVQYLGGGGGRVTDRRYRIDGGRHAAISRCRNVHRDLAVKRCYRC